MSGAMKYPAKLTPVLLIAVDVEVYRGVDHGQPV